jgi:ADP-ribosyl-[dinitrogen reductase] hydrolase
MSENAISTKDRVLGALWGALVGDALGVPVEFRNREDVQSDPVTGMRGNGTYHQPKGTWSDDGALILCSVESLLNAEFETQDMGRRFVRWMNEGHWTANGDVFDIGGATASALGRIALGTPAEQAGGRDEHDNGNGSLMRIIPVALRFSKEPIAVFAQRLERASSITHGHPRSKFACVFYGLVVRHLLAGLDPKTALEASRKEFTALYQNSPEFARFRSHLTDDFHSIPESEIVSTGYVLHTLHASLWCLLTTSSYDQCVLRAVNLGGDTDTTGCVAGGLAGTAYGLNAVAIEWRRQLARADDLVCLFHKFSELISS